MPVILIEALPYIVTLLVAWFNLQGKKTNTVNEKGETVKSSEPSGGINITQLILVFAVAYYVKKTWLESIKTNLEENIDKDPEALQARGLYDAFNPSGFETTIGIDGTDTQAVFDIAKTIKNLALVKDKYKILYPGRLLINDLHSELNTSEEKKFYDLVGTGDTTKAPTKRTYKVIANTNAVRWKYANGVDISGGWTDSEAFKVGDELGTFVKNFTHVQKETGKNLVWIDLIWTDYIVFEHRGFVAQSSVKLVAESLTFATFQS